MDLDLAKFRCPHCDEVKLHPEMIERLKSLQVELGGDLPPVATAYRCETWEKEHNFGSGHWHQDGAVVSFETGNQYLRHTFLRAALSCFSQVGIYPARVAVALTTDKSPFCLTVL